MRRALQTCLLVLAFAAGCNVVFDLRETVVGPVGSRTLVFDNAASRHDLIDFPVLIPLDETTMPYAVIADPTRDLRFHDSRTNQDLPFEIERWDPSGESDVWVRVPRIVAGSKTDSIMMYYGASAKGTEAPADVWQGFDLVVHGKPNDFSNAAGSAYSGTAVGVKASDGPIAGALSFGGTGTSMVSFANSGPLFNGWNQFTLELWIYPDYTSSKLNTVEPRFIDKGASLNLGRLYAYQNIDGILALQIDTHFTNRNDSYLSAFVPLQVWVHIVYSYDGQTMWLYRNGTFANVAKFTMPETMVTDASNVSLGAAATALNGQLDEVRVSHQYRDSDWVYAQYLSMTRRFVRFVAPK